jgi:hypothetical protein
MSTSGIELFCLACNGKVLHLNNKGLITCSQCYREKYSSLASICPTCKKQWYIPDRKECLWCDSIGNDPLHDYKAEITFEPTDTNGDTEHTSEAISTLTIKYQLLRAAVLEYMGRVKSSGSKIDDSELQKLLDQI